MRLTAPYGVSEGSCKDRQLCEENSRFCIDKRIRRGGSSM